jgi:hypothetical protein
MSDDDGTGCLAITFLLLGFGLGALLCGGRCTVSLTQSPSESGGAK